ncbi:transposase, partial [Dechloromonas sp.]|uniref:transposase n=1 Tax=Dechloromonas sp. TaxID=1917218 RepID=UPI00263F936F
DALRRALLAIPEAEGVRWLDRHLSESTAPLLDVPWILDIDTTIKPLYGKQEGAVVSYNPKKPGRPSHSYHTYLMAGLRLVMGVEVKAGNEHSGSHTLPGLLKLLDELPAHHKPKMVRGDCGFGSDGIMRELEARAQPYLFLRFCFCLSLPPVSNRFAAQQTELAPSRIKIFAIAQSGICVRTHKLPCLFEIMPSNA